MIEIDVAEAQLHLKEYLDKVTLGEQVIVRDGPALKFELKQIEAALVPPRKPRRMGAGVGQGIVLPEFYDPLPDDILAYFEGRGEVQEDPMNPGKI